MSDFEVNDEVKMMSTSCAFLFMLRQLFTFLVSDWLHCDPFILFVSGSRPYNLWQSCLRGIYAVLIV